MESWTKSFSSSESLSCMPIPTEFLLPPEERYVDLMRRYPELKEHRPLKEIASFIGVTPETVSAIRRKLLKERKS